MRTGDVITLLVVHFFLFRFFEGYILHFIVVDCHRQFRFFSTSSSIHLSSIVSRHHHQWLLVLSSYFLTFDMRHLILFIFPSRFFCSRSSRVKQANQRAQARIRCQTNPISCAVQSTRKKKGSFLLAVKPRENSLKIIKREKTVA